MTKNESPFWKLVDSDPGMLPVYGCVVFTRSKTISSKSHVENHNLYFSKQVLDETYLLHGLIHILLNCDQIDIGVDLNQFKQLTNNSSSALKGQMLIKNRLFKDAYQDLLSSIPQTEKKSSETYRSIAYIFSQGKLWELDALKDGPCIIERCSEKNWLGYLQTELLKKSEVYQPISVWAIVENRKLVYQRKLTSRLFMKQEIEKILDDHQPNWRATMRLWEEEYRYALESNGRHKRGLLLSKRLMSSSYRHLPTKEERGAIYDLFTSQHENPLEIWLQIHDDLLRSYESLGLEDEQEEMHEKDYTRRKHNYVPFIKSFIKALYEEGHLHNQLSL
ncbi:hypothetical protein G6F37_012046 [Rhizopus arrhizus]|nr:hypothetical protein G6F38_012314 [Rhizopus arrhizus]KAG1146007.1 hypothetical protein G6F37_012046 [Rhizopus arrhizus]